MPAPRAATIHRRTRKLRRTAHLLIGCGLLLVIVHSVSGAAAIPSVSHPVASKRATATPIARRRPPTPTVRPLPTATPTPLPDIIASLGPQANIGPVLSAIVGAQQRLLVTTSGLSDPSLLAALVHAVARGVDVRVLYDANSADLSTLLGLANQGVREHVASPDFSATAMNSVVEDNRMVVFSSAAFTPYALRSTRHMIIADSNHADILQAAALFFDDWDLRSPRQFGPHLIIGPTSFQSTVSALLGHATSTLDIATQQLGSADVAAAVLQAARVGVKVRVLLSVPSDGTTTQAFDLVRAGIAVHQSLVLPQRGLVVFVDGQQVFIDSADLTYNGVALDRSLGVLLQDPSTIDTLATAYNYDWARSAPLHLPTPTPTVTPASTLPSGGPTPTPTP